MLLLEGRDWQVPADFHPALPGAHQQRNAALAWTMIEAQSALPVSRDQFKQGLATAEWPARFQRLAPGPLAGDRETWLDGAHNVDAAAALAAELARRGPMHLVLGILANKDAAGIVDLLRAHALSLTFVPVPDHPSHNPAAMAEQFGGRAAATLGEALGPLPSPILIAGSLYLAGGALAANLELPD